MSMLNLQYYKDKQTLTTIYKALIKYFYLNL